MTNGFDAGLYSGVPTLNAALTLAMARRLVAEMPEPIIKSELTAVAAQRLRERAAKLREERLKALDVPETVDARVFDQSEDRAWSALHQRLAAWTEIEHPNAQRAVSVVERLFPEGLRFLTLPHKEQWEETQRALQLIDKEDIAPVLDELCGAPFLETVKTHHVAYGEALGLTQAKPAAPEVAEVGDRLLSLRDAIRFYTRRVLALADEEDPSSVRMVERALTPLREMGEEARRRRAAGTSEPEPDDEGELPPLPAPPPGV